MQKKRLAMAVLIGSGIAFSPASAVAQLLGTASDFAVLGSTPSVTNSGPTVVTGSVGISPALAITGFPPGAIVPGTGVFQAGGAVAAQARADVTAAHITLAGLPSAAIAAQLGGQTLTPGTYRPIAGDFDLTGTLTLNGPGLYIFQTPAGLTTASGPGASSVVVIGGASACDIWWEVGSSAAIGTFSAVQGNILALTSITLGTSASLQGRALARNGAVTLASNVVTACSGGASPGFFVPPLGAGAGVGSLGIPTLSQWALVILAALLAMAGFGSMRRKQGHLPAPVRREAKRK